MSPFTLNLVDRIAWTAFQALGGTIAAGESADALHVGVADDWRPALIGSLVAGVLCLLKVLGVHVSHQALTAVEDAAGSLARMPGAKDILSKVRATSTGSIAADVVAGVDRQLRAETHGEADASAPPAEGGPVD